MTYWTASAKGPVTRSLVASTACRTPGHRAVAAKVMAIVPLALAFGIATGSPSWAQQPDNAPAATAPAKPKPAKKAAKPKPDEQQAAPAAAEAPPAPMQQAQPAPGSQHMSKKVMDENRFAGTRNSFISLLTGS